MAACRTCRALAWGGTLLSPSDLKVCTKCGIGKTPDNFQRAKKEKYQLAQKCKLCRKEDNKKYYIDNPGRVTEQVRSWRENNLEKYHQNRKAWRSKNRERANWYARKYKYGISYQEGLDVMKSQGNSCAICGKVIAGSRFHIDHDHRDGSVRGFLCHQCNLGIGNFMDSQQILLKAIEYLKRHS